MGALSARGNKQRFLSLFSLPARSWAIAEPEFRVIGVFRSSGDFWRDESFGSLGWNFRWFLQFVDEVIVSKGYSDAIH